MSKNREGRPTAELFADPHTIQSIKELGAQGLTQEMICRILKINIRTLEVKREYIAALEEAVQEGVALGAQAAGSSLLKKVREGDLGAIKWYEQTRVYKKNMENYLIDVSGSHEITLSNEAIDARIKELEEKMKGL